MIRTSAALVKITTAILYLLRSSFFPQTTLSDIQSSSTPNFRGGLNLTLFIMNHSSPLSN